ncbi:SipW-dependent-type signal peptide-containing protein [Mycetocola spongiae]|uniref:SipW-dependent-type signal peptide-containing protein n=1 Tax=Mycetocola spongiae TaxID=2859226 RepID=UPI001CF1286F|nr:SipW-dependent-type signal peptide-containing protein [Mycetocola spongiae]UCR88879.1 SipW-dependent-type signal peptide-containing protein [Mycetocola spongiae]
MSSQITDPITAQAAAPHTSRPRVVRAILAGGLVLGLGSALTLAAWNDSEFAGGLFSAGSFNLEGSTTDGATGFSDHNTTAGNAAATLTFSLPVNGNLSPGSTVFAPLWLRLAAGTTDAAELRTEALTTVDTGGDNSTRLGYGVYALNSATAACDATGVAAGTRLAGAPTLATDTGIDSAAVALPQGADTHTAGAATKLCIVVTAAPSLAQGGSTTATWQFSASSK